MITLKTGRGRTTVGNPRVPDAESWPCPTGGLHELTNGGCDTFCAKCEALWADIDSEIRASVGWVARVS